MGLMAGKEVSLLRLPLQVIGNLLFSLETLQFRELAVSCWPESYSESLPDFYAEVSRLTLRSLSRFVIGLRADQRNGRVSFGHM